MMMTATGTVNTKNTNTVRLLLTTIPKATAIFIIILNTEINDRIWTTAGACAPVNLSDCIPCCGLSWNIDRHAHNWKRHSV